MKVNDLDSAKSALREICEITEIDNPMLAMQCFTRECVMGIQQYWIPFWHFRTFWAHELSPKHIINPRVGNREFVNHRCTPVSTVQDVELALGITNLRKQVMPIHSFVESFAVSHVVDAILDDQLSVLEVGALVAICDTFDITTAHTPEIVLESGKCCLGMILAHKIVQKLF